MKNIEKHELQEEVKWAGLLNEFLWTCAGVNKRILRQCRTDYAKYAGIGGTILFTALMAMLSGGYAIYTIFNSTIVAICFGVFWGLLIFNLDRFMVNTMYSDGTHKITLDEFKGGFPRLILAIFLGIVISAPIELRIFDDKIQSQLLIDQGKVSDDVKEANEALYNERTRLTELRRTYEDRLSELRNGDANGVSSRIIEMERSLEEAENRLYEETNGTGITKKRGFGPAAQKLQEQVDRMRKTLDDLREQERIEKNKNQEYIDSQIANTQTYIDDVNRQLKNVLEQIAQKEAEENKATVALKGFTARLKAMSEVTEYSKDPMLYWARVMIMLLFIAIEIIPTLFKMMMTSGPYDDLLRSEMHKARVMSDKRISDLNDEINTEILISTEKNKNRLEAEIAANKEVMSRIAEVQSELLNTAIEKWRKEELEKIEKNPSAYIKSNSNV